MKESLSALILLLLMSCSMENLSGTSSDTTTGTQVGVVRTPGGNPVAGANVVLRKAGVSSWRDTTVRTDSSGSFRVDSVDTGIYYIEVFDEDTILGVLEQSEVFPGEVASIELEVDEFGQITGRLDVDIVESDSLMEISIVELGRKVKVNAVGVFELTKLPPWTYTAVLSANGGEISTELLTIEKGQTNREISPDNNYSLTAYRLTDSQSAGFSETDGELSTFWKDWGLRDFIYMSPKSSTSNDRAEFTGEDDARVTLKAAADEEGLYVLVTVTDDRWESSGSFPQWGIDAVDFYIDKMSSAENWLSRNKTEIQPWPDRTLTKTSKHFQLWMGSETKPSSFRYSKYEESSGSWKIDHVGTATSKERFNGLAVEVVPLGTTRKAQEWFIPWTELGFITMPIGGQRLALAGGFNDIDEIASAGALKCLRWKNGSDPFSPAVGNELPDAWGDIKMGPGF